VTKNNYLAHNARGITYGELGQYQLAIEDFNKAISLKQDYADAYYNRGYAYTNLGQYQRAIEDYNEVIRLKPDNEEARRLLKFALEMEQQQKRVN
jgi:tetratricopeptide (TPR) repeat protein